MSGTPGSHLDSSGRVRVRSERWGVNLFTTRQDAGDDAREALTRTHLLRLWRTTDGLYAWSSCVDPPRSPYLLDAVDVTYGEAARGE